MSTENIVIMRTFHINPLFFAAAHELPKEIAKKVWKALHLFSENPRHPSLHFEALEGTPAGLSSLRVDDNYRIILQENAATFTLLYVASHEMAYRYAGRIAISARAMVAEEPRSYYVRSAEEVFKLPEREIAMLVGTIKYLPLATFLVTRPKTEQRLELTFSEIEQIIQASLPPTARKYNAWWANEEGKTRHVQANSWTAVGWRKEYVNLKKGIVSFEREDHPV